MCILQFKNTDPGFLLARKAASAAETKDEAAVETSKPVDTEGASEGENIVQETTDKLANTDNIESELEKVSMIDASQDLSLNIQNDTEEGTVKDSSQGDFSNFI